jgi:hypothetical protein
MNKFSDSQIEMICSRVVQQMAWPWGRRGGIYRNHVDHISSQDPTTGDNDDEIVKPHESLDSVSVQIEQINAMVRSLASRLDVLEKPPEGSILDKR